MIHTIRTEFLFCLLYFVYCSISYNVDAWYIVSALYIFVSIFKLIFTYFDSYSQYTFELLKRMILELNYSSVFLQCLNWEPIYNILKSILE